MIINIAIKILNIYSLLIIVRALYSWINLAQGRSRLYYYLCLLTEPVLGRFRFISQRLNLPIDLSPVIAILLINFIKNALIYYV